MSRRRIDPVGELREVHMGASILLHQLPQRLLTILSMNRWLNVAQTGSLPYRGLPIRGTADYQSALQVGERSTVPIRIHFLEILAHEPPNSLPRVGAVALRQAGLPRRGNISVGFTAPIQVNSLE